MRILSIETSCDETAVSLVEGAGGLASPSFTVHGNSLFSQIELHKEYGGVFPMLAKREHVKNLPPLLLQTLTEAGEKKETAPTAVSSTTEETWKKIENILAREEGLFESFKRDLEHLEKPNIEAICVTCGPGLEPALWVGISFAVALGLLWGIPVVPVNHMEGHIVSVLMETNDDRPVSFPALALLISGGHTEIVEVSTWGSYTVIGRTRDDAVGEAFDKVARLLGLPYPGGPEISKLAEQARNENIPNLAKFPRPMINSGDLSFSFSGLKTSVLYYLRDFTEKNNRELAEDDKKDIAREFEDAVVETLLHKTKAALEETGAGTLIIAGGVIANKKIRETFKKLEETYSGLLVKTPVHALATDNALMIASAGYIQTLLYPEKLTEQKEIRAQGNLELGKKI